MIPIVIVIPFLVTATVLDFQKEKIPNFLSILCLIFGITFQLFEKHLRGVCVAVISFSIVLVITFFLYRIGALGAGDCKLIAAASTYFSFQDGLIFLMTALFIGAVISLARLLFISFTSSCSIQSKLKIHFALPILLSGLWVVYVRQ